MNSNDQAGNTSISYRDAGVDIEAGDALVEQIQQSRVDYQNEREKFKAVEKAVIKVEEFLKLDWA